MASIKELARTSEFGKILNRVAGEHGSEVVEVLLGEEESTDEEIANETGIRLNLVRKILYDLYDNRVVDYRRTRDDDTGWYTYRWHVEPNHALELLEKNKRTLLEKFKERLEHERETMFFSCGNNCPRVEFDEAMEHGFECPQCGEEMEEFDNSGIINALERQIETLQQELMGS
ncbi:hypothetical protein AKJ63_00840 [candidate division MSBL1 archaeon SCGC-AAA259D18]|uniref:Transcription factor E n=1 Tax=candidate division MSBL1 archaeon SCGC-AAA259D18 TaxID=1698262 RepID=A0A133UC85_9EURY|nr:hypothetical protein AKJ63_00840 [candidate division MSBL1 archaeon SCGC-AAA259D18]